MYTLVVGGHFGSVPKKSSIVVKLGNELMATVINGGKPQDLQNISLEGYNLIIWMPDIDNKYAKYIPKKDKGSVLIISKVINKKRKELDAITRIFNFKGNAVIGIKKDKSPLEFKLIDALGNVWMNGINIELLAGKILDLCIWTKDSIRKSTDRLEINLHKLVELNTKVADIFEDTQQRYFGNCSSRCAKLFPSSRVIDGLYYVSKRNVNKKRLTTDDMVQVIVSNNNQIKYIGRHKPSIDAPVQIKLYQKLDNINYFIHGHTYIENPYYTTTNYFPCGDLREVEEIFNKIKGSRCGTINLRNHGFLIYANTVNSLEFLVNTIKLTERKLGFEIAEGVI